MNKTKTETKTAEAGPGEATRKEKRGVNVALIDQWLAEHYTEPADILGKEGLLAQLTKAVVERRRPNPETEKRRNQIKLFYGREVKPSMRTTLDELTCLCRRLGIKRVATVPFGLEHEGLELADWQAEAGAELQLTFYCEKLGDYVSLGGTPPPRVLTRRFGVGPGLARRANLGPVAG